MLDILPCFVQITTDFFWFRTQAHTFTLESRTTKFAAKHSNFNLLIMFFFRVWFIRFSLFFAIPFYVCNSVHNNRARACVCVWFSCFGERFFCLFRYVHLFKIILILFIFLCVLVSSMVRTLFSIAFHLLRAKTVQFPFHFVILSVENLALRTCFIGRGWIEREENREREKF